MPLLWVFALGAGLIAGLLCAAVVAALTRRRLRSGNAALAIVIAFLAPILLAMWLVFARHEIGIDGPTAFRDAFAADVPNGVSVVRASATGQYDASSLHLQLRGESRVIAAFLEEKGFWRITSDDLPADPRKNWDPPDWWLTHRCDDMRSYEIDDPFRDGEEDPRSAAIRGQWTVFEVAECPREGLVYVHAATL